MSRLALALGAGIGLLVLAAAGGAKASGTSPGEPHAYSQDDARVFLCGDSLAVGLAPELSRLCAESGVHFDASTQGGTSVCQWALDSWIGEKLRTYRPNIVVVSLGTNDYQRTDPDHVRSSVHEFMRRCHAAGASVLWIRPPTMPIADKIGVCAMWQAELTRNDDVFDASKLTIPRGPDHIHPTGEGYKAFARAIWQAMTIPPPEGRPEPTTPAPKAQAPAPAQAARQTAPSTSPAPAAAGALLLPQEPGPAREEMILEAVRRGWHLPVKWEQIDLSRGAHSCHGQVMADALILVGTRITQNGRMGFRVEPDGPNRARPCVSQKTAQRIADLWGASLNTTRTVDRSYEQATVVLAAHPLGASNDMATTSVMLRHHDAVEQDRNGRTGLVRTVGKDWILSANMKPGAGINFGWELPEGSAGHYKSPAGRPVLQPIPSDQRLGHFPHNSDYTDYSQQLTLVWGKVEVDGEVRRMIDLLADPDLAWLVSDEGPLQYVRHPDVPWPGGNA